MAMRWFPSISPTGAQRSPLSASMAQSRWRSHRTEGSHTSQIHIAGRSSAQANAGSPQLIGFRSPNGHIQLAAVGDHVSVVDLADNRIIRNIDVGKWADPTGVALSSTGSTIYLTFGRYGTSGEVVAELNASTGQTIARIATGVGPNAGSDLIAVSPHANEAFVSGFDVVTPGPDGPVVFRGVVPIDLRSGRADRPISFGAPVAYGLSTGAVFFGQ